MSNPEASWRNIESAFGSIRFLLTRLCPNYDTKYSSQETSDSIKDLMDCFNELSEKIKSFKGIVKDFENQNKMVKVEVGECFMFTEDICKKLKETSSSPYFSLTIPELKEKTEELGKYLDDLRKKESSIKENLLDQFASRDEPLFAEKEHFLSDGSQKGLLNPDDKIEI